MSTCKHDVNRPIPFPAPDPRQSAPRASAFFSGEETCRTGCSKPGASYSGGPAETIIEPVCAAARRRFAPRYADT